MYRILELYGCTKTPNEGLKWTPQQVFQEIHRIECGTYECDEEVEIDIFSQNNIEPNLQIGFMNIGEFEKIINQMNSEVTINDRKVFKRKAVIDITASKPGYYIVPIGYSENWKVKVNGEKVDTFASA